MIRPMSLRSARLFHEGRWHLTRAAGPTGRAGAVILAGFAAAFVRAAGPSSEPPPAAVMQLAAPTAPDASAPVLQRAEDGRVWLAWVQPVEGAGLELRIAELAASRHAWMLPTLISTVPHFAGGPAAGPALAAAPGGRLAAAWSEGAGAGRRIVGCFSADGGVDWSTPAALSTEGRPAGAPALTALADGRFLLTWTEAGTDRPAAAASLQSRILSPQSATSPAPVPSAAVVPSTLPAVSAFPDGGALAAYLGRDARGMETLRLTRLSQTGWSAPQSLPDGRRLQPLPDAVGPALASDGGRVAVAWLTGQGPSAHVFASMSPDAGERFLMPEPLDDGSPFGRPAVVLLHDRTVLTIWLAAPHSEEPARLWLRRLSPDFTPDSPALLASLPADPAGWPTVALVRDYLGGSDSAQILVAFASPHRHALSLRTLLVTVPEATLVAAANDACHCAPAPEELAGFPIGGRIVGVNPAAGTLQLEHREFPGLLQAGTDTLAVAPEIAAVVAPGMRCLGRIERRNGGWQFFEVRKLADR